MSTEKKVNFKSLNKPSYFIRSGDIVEIVSKLSKDKKILELGCGKGELCKKIMALGYKDVELVDLDNYTNGLPVKLVDLAYDNIPFENERFDAVLAIAIVEHLENPFLIFRETFRVLRKDGVFIMAIPNALSLKSRLKFLFDGNLTGYNERNNHIAFMPKAVFSKMVLRYFDVEDKRYGQGYLKILNKKIYFKNPWLRKQFSDKVLFVLKKKSV